MLQVDHPDRPLDAALLDAPGGFAWWYADGRNVDGDGFVLILSWGLPFLPGDRAARLAGHPVPARDRPSVNLALYRRGVPIYYTLHTLTPERASWRTGGGGAFGDCDASFTTSGDQVTLSVQIDLPIPGDAARLTGTIEVSGPRLHGDAPLHANLVHCWTPLIGPARTEVRLTRSGRPFFELSGSGYADRNGSQVALDGLSLARWTWGRAEVAGKLVIHYLSWPNTPGAKPELLWWEADANGHFVVSPVSEVQLDGESRTWLGMTWWRTIHLHVGVQRVTITSTPPVDNGPFYLRLLTQVQVGEAQGPGWSEICEPDRIDLPQHRWLVQMCVDPDTTRPSIWLPLFGGPAQDRVQRLLRAWCTPRRT